jgi:acetyl-CoA carboxylase carboxyl transferase beta subunit/acetyl-CoA carboxylase carboxyl transferase alpha subunit
MLGRFTAPGPSRERPLQAPGPRLKPVARSGSVACKGCGRRFVLERYEGALRVCPWCGHHGQLPAAARAAQLADPGSVQPVEIQLADRDPLGFDDGRPYPARVAEARQKTGLDEAFLIARASIGGAPAILAIMDFGFLGGSLGSAAGELFAQGCELAVAERRALVAVSSSGGARMQEGIASLAQMARCTAGVSTVADAGLPYISVLADPCFGGVTASFAAQGDVILAEPGARIGFAGGRVIEQAAHEALPEGFQTAEFLLSHGMVDQVVDRRELRALVAGLLRALTAGRAGGDLTGLPATAAEAARGDVAGPAADGALRHSTTPGTTQHAPETPAIGVGERVPAGPGPSVADTLSTSEREKQAFTAVELARNPGRPRTLQLLRTLFHDFTELRGDRLFGDDRAVIGGTAQLGGSGATPRDDVWVMVIGQEKGNDAASRVIHNFGMPHPEGYRKATRLMRLAEKFGLPVICLVDTPAAAPGVGAEERGQAWAIADSLLTLLRLRTPVISCVLSEGGSGGALALGIADCVLALENAIYCVAPPETVAAILYRDAAQKARAAAAQRPWVGTAYRLGLVDELIPEPAPGAHAHPQVVAGALRGALLRHLAALRPLPLDVLLQRRSERYRRAGD